MSEVDIPQGETIVVPTGVTHEVTVEVPPRPELRITEVIVGPVGPQGPPGADGVDGQDGQSATFMDYMYNSTETGAPSSGQVRTNATSNPPAVTAIYLSNFTSPGVDVSRVIGKADTGTEVDLQDKDDSTRYETYRLIGPAIDHGTFWEYPVEYVDAGLPVPAQRIWVAVLNEGTPGPQGPPGADSTVPGPQGPPGPGVPLPVYDECGDLAVWTGNTGTGTLSVQTVADSAVGGKVIRATGAINTHYRAPLVPFDPTALYRIKFRVRQVTDPTVGGSTVWLGLMGVAADGVTWVNTNGAPQSYPMYNVAADGLVITAAQGWQEFVGYLKGVAAPGTSAPAPSPSGPGRAHTNVRYVRPFFTLNWDGNGTTEIDYVSLEVVPEPATPLPLYDECGSLTPWVRYGDSGTGTISTVQVADSAAGGKVFRATGDWNSYRAPLVPYDPNALYRIKFRVRQFTDANAGSTACIFAGVMGVGADGVTMVAPDGTNTHFASHYICAWAAPMTVAQGWQEFTGYLKGTAAAGTSGPPTSPSAPGKVHTNVRYIRPYVFLNWNTWAPGNGVADLDYVSLEIVDQVSNTSGEVTLSGDGTAGAPLSAALTGVRNGNLTVTGDVVAARGWFGGGTGEAVFIGDDAKLADINQADAIGIQGRQSAANGKLVFGDGLDTNLFRAGVDVLRTDDNFQVGGALNVDGSVSSQYFWAGTTANGGLLRIWDVTNPIMIEGYASGGLTCRLYISSAGLVMVGDGATDRPIPFAMFGVQVGVVFNNGTAASTVVNFPTGRFTQIPVCSVTGMATSLRGPFINNVTASSISIGLWNSLNTAITATVQAQAICMQMTPASTPTVPGRSGEDVEPLVEPDYPRYSICETPGCENKDIPIGTFDTESPVVCGPCGVTISQFE